MARPVVIGEPALRPAPVVAGDSRERTICLIFTISSQVFALQMVLRRSCSADATCHVIIQWQFAIRNRLFEEFFGDETGGEEEIGDGGGGSEVVFGKPGDGS